MRSLLYSWVSLRKAERLFWAHIRLFFRVPGLTVTHVAKLQEVESVNVAGVSILSF